MERAGGEGDGWRGRVEREMGREGGWRGGGEGGRGGRLEREGGWRGGMGREHGMERKDGKFGDLYRITRGDEYVLIVD